MNFVRFGNEVINLDLVKKADIAEDKVVLYFANTIKNSYDKEVSDSVIYKGEIAKYLYQFFMENSTDSGITPAPKTPGKPVAGPPRNINYEVR